MLRRKLTHASYVSYAIVFQVKEGFYDVFGATALERDFADIAMYLSLEHGFDYNASILSAPYGRGIYFGGESVNAVACVIAIQEAAKKFECLSTSAMDATMLRIDERTDLIPATYVRASIDESERLQT